MYPEADTVQYHAPTWCSLLTKEAETAGWERLSQHPVISHGPGSGNCLSRREHR